MRKTLAASNFRCGDPPAAPPLPSVELRDLPNAEDGSAERGQQLLIVSWGGSAKGTNANDGLKWKLQCVADGERTMQESVVYSVVQCSIVHSSIT